MRSRAPRKARPASKAQTVGMLQRLQTDHRYRHARPRTKVALDVAMVRYADADGRLWPKLSTWAEDAGM
jgi:hypothetical protein